MYTLDFIVPGPDVGERFGPSDVKHECDPVGVPVHAPDDSRHSRLAHTVAFKCGEINYDSNNT